jgi:serine/threonine-protein kinase HipA
MMDQRLDVLFDGQPMGRVERNRRNRLVFQYDPLWSASPGSIPLSISLPFSAREHTSEMIEAFIWGLLPDNEFVLGRWAKNFHVSARNPFALIANVGEDCAGAVQFVRREKLRAFLSDRSSKIEWLAESQVAERLRALRRDQAAWRMPRDTGQFSLAGAQAKTALLQRRGRWGIPSGRIPTTHILKPQSNEFDGHAENEHFCLVLAQALQLPAARSEVHRFGDEVAIVIERYDRVSLPEGDIIRIHQEDMCQALGVMPTSKYKSEGGPRPAEIAELLRKHSSRPREDVETFIDALVFNWLIGGTDAHAKNYSLLHGSGGKTRLAPLYDLASALPYDRLDERKLKLAMRIGREYRLMSIGVRQWQKAGSELGLEEGQLLRRARALARAMGREIPTVAERMRSEGLSHPIVDKLSLALRERTRRCLEELSS